MSGAQRSADQVLSAEQGAASRRTATGSDRAQGAAARAQQRFASAGAIRSRAALGVRWEARSGDASPLCAGTTALTSCGLETAFSPFPLSQGQSDSFQRHPTSMGSGVTASRGTPRPGILL